MSNYFSVDPAEVIVEFINIKAQKLAKQNVSGKPYSKWMPYVAQELLEMSVDALKIRFEQLIEPSLAVKQAIQKQKTLHKKLSKKRIFPRGYAELLTDILSIFDLLIINPAPLLHDEKVYNENVWGLIRRLEQTI